MAASGSSGKFGDMPPVHGIGVRVRAALAMAIPHDTRTLTDAVLSKLMKEPQ